MSPATNGGMRRPRACDNYLKEMVGRDGIEPPTPGFSGLTHPRNCAQSLAAERRPQSVIVVRSGPECSRMRLSWAHFGHKPAAGLSSSLAPHWSVLQQPVDDGSRVGLDAILNWRDRSRCRCWFLRLWLSLRLGRPEHAGWFRSLFGTRPSRVVSQAIGRRCADRFGLPPREIALRDRWLALLEEERARAAHRCQTEQKYE
jgi:hypothetical protein